MNDDTTTRAGMKPGLTVSLVVAAFLAPVLLAWWFARSGAPQLGGELVNHGRFIQPPLDVRATAALEPLREIALGPGEWAVVVYGEHACAAACQQAADNAERIHQVLGHDGTRVRLVLLTDAPASASIRRQLVDPAARQAVATAAGAAGAAAAARSGVVLLDWRGQVMMAFAADTPPADIKKDLKRLLRGSKTG